MKIRQGFVSNSSSSSFVLLLPEKFNVDLINWDDAQVQRELGNRDMEVEDGKKAIEKLLMNNYIAEYDDGNDFHFLSGILREYVVAGFDTSSDCGEIQLLDMKKVNQILGK